MSLSPGMKFAEFEIVAPLGAGGMGEVYRAIDTKLDRQVALKMLPNAVARDPERVARFEREAKLLASLNHPQIASIYGFEYAVGKRFLVLELVEGPTLKDRLKAGPIQVTESLEIARQICEALAEAHEKGIVHRDLKPANVKVTPDGKVKVLDFGLAKALSDEEEVVNSGTSPTITQHHTMPGMILGTASYMSPEQARGRVVDKRTDVWSLGCLLYECLTGERVFEGETVTDVIGAILHKQPDWQELPADTPPTVKLLLRRCLTKERNQRLHDVSDARVELEDALADPTSSSLGLADAVLATGTASSRQSLRVFATIVTAMLLTALVTWGSVWWMDAPPPPAPIERYTITLPQRESATGDANHNTLGVSADGRMLSYTAKNEIGGYDLFLRYRDQVLPTTLTRTTWRTTFPTISPDGQWIVYFDSREDKLLKMSVRGGASITLCEEYAYINGITWSTDGFIMFADRRNPSSLIRIGENGGATEVIALPHASDKQVRFVHALPNGEAVLYAAAEDDQGGASSAIEIYLLQSGTVKKLVDNATFPLFAHSGHLLFMRDATLMASPFDIETSEITGQAVPVLQNVRHGYYGAAQIAITKNGTLFHRQAQDQTNTPKGIYQRSLDGDKKTELVSPRTGDFRWFSASADGEYIAVEIGNEERENSRIWILEPKRDVLTPLTTEPGTQTSPSISPDGQWAYYSATDANGKWRGIYRRRRDGSGTEELVDNGPRECFITSISTDGMHLLVTELPSEALSPGSSYDIAVIHLGEDGGQAMREPWLDGPMYQIGAEISPNGRWVAYRSGHSRQSQIYVKPFSGDGATYHVSPNVGTNASWSPDGKSLYFQQRSNNGKLTLMEATVTAGMELVSGEAPASFATDLPEAVLDLGSLSGWGGISHDGASYVRIEDVRQDGEEEAVDDLAVIHVTKNFFTELQRLSPTKAK